MKKTIGSGWAQKPVLTLLVLYLGVSLLRFLLALATSAFPTVSIDEFLYYGLARSIATEGKLLFRGQPADYSYILYPLVLSPIYLFFQEGANFYRLIQAWNILLMSSAVFPMYGLCRAMTGDNKKAMLLTAVFVLMPDLILGQFIFSEAIIYPLFYTVLCCAYRFIVSKDPRHLLLIGGLGALLFYAKPGAMAPSAVFLLVFLVQAVREKNGRQAAFCAASGAVFRFCSLSGHHKAACFPAGV